jgi:hypothetical protein
MEETIMKKTLVLTVLAAFLTVGCAALDAAHLAWMSAHIGGKVLNGVQRTLTSEASRPSSGPVPTEERRQEEIPDTDH